MNQKVEINENIRENATARYLKVTETVAFNFASEASYV